MAAAKTNSAVLSVRAKDTIALTPGLLGFSSLIEPDTYDPEKPVFKLNLHLTPAGITAMAALIDGLYKGKVYDDLVAQAAEAKFSLKGAMPGSEWMEEKLKEPKEGSWSDLPHFQVKVPSSYVGRDKQVVERTIACWDHANKKLPLKKLRLGRGSTIQPVVYPNLFVSSQMGRVIQPTFKLVGVRVLSLVQFGGGSNAAAESDNDEIARVMGAGYEADDLSAFMGMDDEEEPGKVSPPADAGETVGGIF